MVIIKLVLVTQTRRYKMLTKDVIGTGLSYKKLFICKVDDYVGSYNPDTGDVRYSTFDKFTEFVIKLLKDNPEYSPHNTTDCDIENIIRNKIQLDLIITNRKTHEI